jgi:benzylsuccinate CoA-transferase BbsE subunit
MSENVAADESVPADAGAAGDPLRRVRVLDCADATGAYSTRLLADLGADVVIVEGATGSSARSHEPIVEVAGVGSVSCFDRFVNLNKRSIALDLSSDEDRAVFLRLVAGADVLVDTRDGTACPWHGFGDDELRSANPRLVHLLVSAYGERGPYAARRSDDLTTLAAGGLLSLGGYPDAGPVAVCGDQTYFARSIFAAAAAVMALIERDRTGMGDTVEVSGQEAIANALEDAIPDADINGRVRRRRGDRPREAATGTYRCADGYVAMVAGRLGTAKAFATLVEWMVTEGTEGADELLDSKWADNSYRQSPDGIVRFGDVFERFASTRTKAALYEDAQRRGIALAPVNTPAEVLGDAQLAAREFFVVVGDGVPLVYPGRPFRMDGLGPFVRRHVPRPGEHTEEILSELEAVGS